MNISARTEYQEIEYAKEAKIAMEAARTVDSEVIARLPPGSRVSMVAHGASLWASTARLDVGSGGTRKTYFLKTSFGALGRDMTASEFRCMTRLRAVAPDLVPEAIACGTYAETPDAHFLLCEFRRMTGEVPAAAVLAEKIAELHRRSNNGGSNRFGSDVPTFHGNVRVDHGWSDSWEEYFSRTTRALLEREIEVQGPNGEIRSMIAPFFEKVILRLLRPLETGGRSIRPTLIHGDLWHGNAETDAETGQPIIFDAASFYAHNECKTLRPPEVVFGFAEQFLIRIELRDKEADTRARVDELGVWRQPWNKIGAAYRKEYHKHFPKSRPEEDCDDRQALYAVRVNILDSILYKDDPSYREMLIAGMRELVDKYPGGFEEWENYQWKAKTHV